MHKIDSNGATVTNEFTEGNASLSIPATVVSAAWLNAVQKEIVTIVTALGFALKTSLTETGDQLYAAILELIQRGGRASPIIQSVANNQASAAIVTSFPALDKTAIIACEFLYNVFRRTDTANVIETGRVYASYNSETSSWILTKDFKHDDSAVDLSLVVQGGDPNKFDLKYTSDNMSGASYAGTLRITDIKHIRLS